MSTTIPTPQVTPSAQDWAKDATASISHVDDTVKQQSPDHPVDTRPAPKVDRQHSDLSYPFPGSYPRGNEPSTDNLNVQAYLDSAQQTLQNATEAAKRYIPEATEAAKRYIPESVGAYLNLAPTEPLNVTSKETAETLKKVPMVGTPDSGVVPDSGVKISPSIHHEYTLPSTEIPSGSAIGVGSLPGNISEVSVAKLPDERAQENLPSTEVPSGSTVGVGSLPGSNSEASVAKLPEERLQDSLPSHESGHEPLGKTAGVGPLPGPPSESGVARLPDERTHKRDLHKDQDPENVPDVASAATSANLSSTTTQGHEPKQVPGSAVPALKQTPPSSDPEKSRLREHIHEDPVQRTSPEGESFAGHRRSASTGSDGQKVGFMSKVRGEAKIISGKLSGNESKVEEGRHMMGKT